MPRLTPEQEAADKQLQDAITEAVRASTSWTTVISRSIGSS